VEVLRRYSNLSDLGKTVQRVLIRIEENDESNEPNGVASQESGSSRLSDRLSDRLSEADISDIVDRFRVGVSKLSLAEEYGMSLSTMKRLLKARNARRLDSRDSSSWVL
jgi:hypothetical protein